MCCVTHSGLPIHYADGNDYVSVSGDTVTFNANETRACHTIDITQDDICESDPNEFFFSDLSYVGGLPLSIDPSTAQVIIDDTNEPECK